MSARAVAVIRPAANIISRLAFLYILSGQGQLHAFQEEQTTRSLFAYGMRSRARAYRWDKLRRAFTRTRTADNNAPAPPTSASTAVGFSGR